VITVLNPIPVAEPEQIVCDVGVAIAVGLGLTVMVKLCGVPVQPADPLVKVGVTVMVAVTAEVPMFVAVKVGIPVEVPPLLDARPIPGVSFVQVYVVIPPVLVVEKVIAPVPELLQTTWLPGLFTCPVGLTVIVKFCEVPVQLAAPLVNVGMTVMAAVTGAVPSLIAEKTGIPVPPPLAARPIPGVSLIQEYVVRLPDLVVAKVIAAVTELLHTVWFPGLFTCPVGFTVISTVLDTPLQVPMEGITVYRTTAGELVLFVRICEMVLPLPFE